MANYPVGNGYLNTAYPISNGPSFTLLGGYYLIATAGAGSGNMTMLGPDNITTVNVPNSSFGANGTAALYLAPGTYAFVVSTQGGVSVTRVRTTP